jgi:lipoyl(octanoyl) transferase
VSSVVASAADSIEVVDETLGSRLIPYTEAWERQRRLQAAVAEGTAPDTLLLLEHEPVYTAGRRTEPWERPTDGTPVVDVDRGGKITWHGPGQLVGYPIIALAAPYDVVGHVRRIELGLIAACAELGLATTQVEGRSGVWVTADARGPDRKVAAIGIRVARGVTMHGFALNADCDLAAFGAIIPCGITDASVTSLSAELGRDVSVADVVDPVRRHVVAALAESGRRGSVRTSAGPGGDVRTDAEPAVGWTA